MKDLWKAGLASRLPQATTLPRESSTGHCTCALVMGALGIMRVTAETPPHPHHVLTH